MTGGPAGDRVGPSYPGVGQDTESAAGQGEVVGHADHSSPDSAGCSHLGPAVHMLTSTTRKQDQLGSGIQV